MRTDLLFRPDGPTKVETLNSYWFFRPSTLPDEMGGKYLRLPKTESGPRTRPWRARMGARTANSNWDVDNRWHWEYRPSHARANRMASQAASPTRKYSRAVYLAPWSGYPWGSPLRRTDGGNAGGPY
jgi:hypothetical protein